MQGRARLKDASCSWELGNRMMDAALPAERPQEKEERARQNRERENAHSRVLMVVADTGSEGRADRAQAIDKALFRSEATHACKRKGRSLPTLTYLRSEQKGGSWKKLQRTGRSTRPEMTSYLGKLERGQLTARVQGRSSMQIRTSDAEERRIEFKGLRRRKGGGGRSEGTTLNLEQALRTRGLTLAGNRFRTRQNESGSPLTLSSTNEDLRKNHGGPPRKAFSTFLRKC